MFKDGGSKDKTQNLVQLGGILMKRSDCEKYVKRIMPKLNEYCLDELRHIALELQLDITEGMDEAEIRLIIITKIEFYVKYTEVINDIKYVMLSDDLYLYVNCSGKLVKFYIGRRPHSLSNSYISTDLNILDIYLRVFPPSIGCGSDFMDKTKIAGEVIVDLNRYVMMNTDNKRMIHGIECSESEVSMLKRKHLFN